MTFELIQDMIAQKLGKVSAELERLESIEMDYQDANATKLDARMRLLTDNQHFLQQLAFFIIAQDEEIATLKDQNNRANIRIGALLNLSERLTLRSHAAQAVTSLLQSKRDYHNRETDNWLKSELGEEDFNLLKQAA